MTENIIDTKEYEDIIENVRKNKLDKKNATDNVFIYEDCKLSIFKARESQPVFTIFDEFGKYLTSILSKSVQIHIIYNMFSSKISKELDKNNISNNDYILYTKGSLVFRNKLMKFINSDLIKNDIIKKIIKNIICVNKNNCVNPILNESDFDVNCIIFNNQTRNIIKNIVAKVLIDIKNEIDDNIEFNKWLNETNNIIHSYVSKTLESSNKKTTQSGGLKKSKKNKNKNTNKIAVKNKLSRKKKAVEIDSDNYFSIYDDQEETQNELVNIFKNKNIKFVKNEENNQSRKSFYINTIQSEGYSVLTEINNFNKLDKYFDNKDLKDSQVFISMHENINILLEKNNFKRNIHFDLYRIKINFNFMMKKSNNNVFKKNITGEVIDVSFPYRNNAYFGQEPVDYESKLMVSDTYKGLNEYNVWGILNDLVETIEIESINISKPNKFEKRINRFILLRFLEYWFRIPFRINKDLSEKTFQIYNSNIKKDGYNFNTFFNKTIYRDYEFARIKNCLEKNQNINIFYLYRKFLRNEPYQTLFKLTREELDNALGLKEEDLKSVSNLIKKHKKLYSIFFDIVKN
jgi:hypothetical protein